MPISHGFRRKTRSLLSRKALFGLSRLLTEYHVKDKVVVDIDPTFVRGMPHRRFQGKVGVVEKVGRRSLTITIPIGDKVKKVSTRLEHVKLLAVKKIE